MYTSSIEDDGNVSAGAARLGRVLGLWARKIGTRDGNSYHHHRDNLTYLPTLRNR